MPFLSLIKRETNVMPIETEDFVIIGVTATSSVYPSASNNSWALMVYGEGVGRWSIVCKALVAPLGFRKNFGSPPFLPHPKLEKLVTPLL